MTDKKIRSAAGFVVEGTPKFSQQSGFSVSTLKPAAFRKHPM